MLERFLGGKNWIFFAGWMVSSTCVNMLWWEHLTTFIDMTTLLIAGQDYPRMYRYRLWWAELTVHPTFLSRCWHRSKIDQVIHVVNQRTKLTRVLGETALKSFHSGLLNCRHFVGELWSVANGYNCGSKKTSFVIFISVVYIFLRGCEHEYTQKNAVNATWSWRDLATLWN